MARFDVYRHDARTRNLVVDVQANLLADIATRVIVPLAPTNEKKAELLPRLKPIILVEAESFILLTTEISVVRTRSLGDFICNIEATHRNDIIAALDFLFQGF